MSARNYDFIIQVANASNFRAGNSVFGLTSLTHGIIANVNYATNQLKIKIDNTIAEFINAEFLISNIAITYAQNVSVTYNNATSVSVTGNNYIINGTANTFALPATSNTSILQKKNIFVELNGNTLPESVFAYPSATLGDRGIDIRPLNYTPAYSATSNANIDVITNMFMLHYGLIDGPLARNILINVNRDASTFTSTILNPSSTFKRLPTNNVTTLTIRVAMGELETTPFTSSPVNNYIQTANSNIVAITPSTYIAAKNEFQQKPLVRLYTLFYPGEWYPSNKNGNPTSEGSGRSWPSGFPYKFAEIRGDLISDIMYNVTFGTDSYVPYPIDSTGIALDSSGKVNQVTLSISNYDNLITQLIENPFLVGNNKSNGISAFVNGELVNNIDPRTVPGNSLYDQSVVDSRGGTNLVFDYDSTQILGGTWQQLKQDSRDLLGAVVEIKSTFAHFLKYWPEYSTVKGLYGNTIEVYTSSPYRINDQLTSNVDSNRKSNIISIRGNMLILNNSTLSSNVVIGEKVFIVNPDSDEDNYVLDTFKIDNLQALNEKIASFSLTSWLQYFKLQLPKRRYYKNTCAWSYKGPECQYPENGSDIIPGTNVNANGFFNIANETVFTVDDDVCARDKTACDLRKNTIHLGAFPATNRTIPR